MAAPGAEALGGLPDAICPDWPAPPGVRALMSTRRGGVSGAPFDSLNLRPAGLSGAAMDEAAAIAENQRRFAHALGAAPVWLDQVHGAEVARLQPGDASPGRPLPRADAAITTAPGIACTVLVADCLPVLLCSDDGRAVGAAHAGWRGLAGGVLDQTVAALCAAAGCGPERLLAWLGPCIGPAAFEVGADVLAAFGADPGAAARPDAPDAAFVYRPRPDGSPRWRADLPALARRRLLALGVPRISGGAWCTVSDPSRFFSFRRDGRTGRLAAAIAIAG
jgi:YfiH family protein